jgi:hypothetical protein
MVKKLLALAEQSGVLLALVKAVASNPGVVGAIMVTAGVYQLNGPAGWITGGGILIVETVWREIEGRRSEPVQKSPLDTIQ